eukprot:CAMPEP_0194048094 /NCGR_PEP_ID=MMETSP0009_2-20130614/26723_1 /TAXON_ID=210454 /ORGANISM="Grammatophora oceanica, Strain CCMP 410" /LENGTH=613 /DNA_ID=CAMNT_0038693901 /DNA_START=50 /DNA_END=1891 /DNA_ORIENTATION=-
MSGLRSPLVLFLLLTVLQAFSLSTAFTLVGRCATNGVGKTALLAKGAESASSDLARSSSSTSAANKDEPSKSKSANERPSPRTVAALALIQTDMAVLKGSSRRRNRNKNNQKPTSRPRKPKLPLATLETNVHYLTMDPRDRAFCRLLVTTVERRRGQLVKILDSLKRKKTTANKTTFNPLSKQNIVTEAVLQLGAAQLLFIDNVKPYAAIKETVDVMRQIPKTPVAEPRVKFVNAILRQLDRNLKKGEKNHDDEGNDSPTPGLQAMLDLAPPQENISPWLYKAWSTQWGDEMARELLDAAMKQAPTYISVKASGGPPEQQLQRREEICEAVGGGRLLPHGSIALPTKRSGGGVGQVKQIPLFEDGVWWVQDASAAVPALALYDALVNPPTAAEATPIDPSSLHVADICASPGGKSAQLLDMGFARPVSLVESSEFRCKRLRSNLERLGYTSPEDYVLHVVDAKEWKPEDLLDGILLDVPCSATGTASKRPDVLYGRTEESVTELMQLQRSLAEASIENCLKDDGGMLAYVTCSTLQQESEDQIQYLLQKYHGSLELVKINPNAVPGFENAITEQEGWLRIMPGCTKLSFSCDGFFVALLKKTGPITTTPKKDE